MSFLVSASHFVSKSTRKIGVVSQHFSSNAAVAASSAVSSSSSKQQSQKLWGGRFEKDTDDRVVAWAESLTCDEEMIVEDLWGSIAHVSMLGRQGIVPADQAAKIVSTLVHFQDEALDGALDFFDEKFSNHDDVHMNMEARLIDATSMEVGGKMHTTRSRNDQVPVSSQMRTRNRLLELRRNVVEVVEAFQERAREPGALETVLPGYTHYQVSLSLKKIAYFSKKFENLTNVLFTNVARPTD